MYSERSQGVPLYIREKARNLLRHYPGYYYTDDLRRKEGLPVPERKDTKFLDPNDVEVYGYDLNAQKKTLEDNARLRRDYYKEIMRRNHEKEKDESSKRVKSSSKRKAKDSKKTKLKGRKK